MDGESLFKLFLCCYCIFIRPIHSFLIRIFFIGIFLLSCKTTTSVPDTGVVLQRPLQEVIALIDYEDQRYRVELENVLRLNPNDILKISELGEKIRIADSVNQLQIFALLDTAGWPDKKLIGDAGSTTIWAVIQHADLETQEKYFLLMKAAVDSSKLEAKYQAYTLDRILTNKGLKQKYGTQLWQFSNGKSIMLPIDNPEKVDSLRATVSLLPLTIHLKDKMGMNWDLKTYYEDLPKADSVLTETHKRYLARIQAANTPH